jgi:hypothetical protein
MLGRQRCDNLPAPCQRASPRWWLLYANTNAAESWTVAGTTGTSGWRAHAEHKSPNRLTRLLQHRHERNAPIGQRDGNDLLPVPAPVLGRRPGEGAPYP